MAVSLVKLKSYLMSRIDKTDLAQVEKVERYVELRKMMERLMKQVKKDGDGAGQKLLTNNKWGWAKIPHK